MLSEINAKTLTLESIASLPSLVLICSKSQNIEQLTTDAGYRKVSLNTPLAKLLIGKTENEILVMMPDIMKTLIPSGHAVYLDDYEMLFDPRYNIDILRMFRDIARTGRLVVEWCGKYKKGILTYAEPEYEDYKRYDLNDYDITCII